MRPAPPRPLSSAEPPSGATIKNDGARQGDLGGQTIRLTFSRSSLSNKERPGRLPRRGKKTAEDPNNVDDGGEA